MPYMITLWAADMYKSSLVVLSDWLITNPYMESESLQGDKYQE